jgi:hypothetical protein
MSSITSQSNLTAAVRQRDNTCRVTAFESGTEVAHLIPEHEKQWFLANSMSMWNTDGTLDLDHVLRDLSNAVLLRSDIHTSFDQRKFVFFPKDAEGFALHMLGPTPDIGQLYHNTRVKIPKCRLEFLFARFAWSIFPFLVGFLNRPGPSRLVVRVNADGKRSVEEVRNPLVLGRRAMASRSNSPAKRSRVASSLDEEIECSKRVRVYGSRDYESSFDSTLPTPRDDSALERHTPSTLNKPGSATHMNALEAMDVSESVAVAADTCDHTSDQADRESPSAIEHSGAQQDDIRIDKLRQEALARQRPQGYDPKIPPYDRHRPAKEELELMGVEIFEDLDEYA